MSNRQSEYTEKKFKLIHLETITSLQNTKFDKQKFEFQPKGQEFEVTAPMLMKIRISLIEDLNTHTKNQVDSYSNYDVTEKYET